MLSFALDSELFQKLLCLRDTKTKESASIMQAALAGIRVIELTQIMAGPFCGMLLADLGAEVIKIENPRGGDDSRRMAPPYYHGESAAFIAMNRNKFGLALDIRHAAGGARRHGRPNGLDIGRQADPGEGSSAPHQPL